MPYYVKGTDTSGTITLRRDTAAAALKKATELTADGCWDVQIDTPEGRTYETSAFDAFRADHAVPSN